MNTDQIQLLVDIAHMYYEQNTTQAEVARRFNISRSLVSKYLAKAQNLGIVEIVIHEERVHPYRPLEEKIKQLYTISDVILVDGSMDSQLITRLGSAAAKHLAKIIKPDSVVGVSAGSSVYSVAETFNIKSTLTDVTFVTMVGGLGLEHTDIQANVVSERLARQIGGKHLSIPAPVMVDTPEAKKVFMEQKFIKDVFDIARGADIALVGIGGTPKYDEMVRAYRHKVDPLTNDSDEEIVGDICYNFINKDGQLVDCSWNKRVLSVNLENIRNIPYVIAVAGGQEKVLGIHAALTGKLVDCLVIDHETAQELIKLKWKEGEYGN